MSIASLLRRCRRFSARPRYALADERDLAALSASVQHEVIVESPGIMIAASLFAHDLTGGDLAAELNPCLGIDIQAARSAPGDEVIRLDYGADRRLAGRLDLALRALGDLVPLIECGGQLLRVRHDLQDARIVVALVPGDTNTLDLHDVFSIGSCRNDDGEARGRCPQGPGRAAQRAVAPEGGGL